MPGTRTGTPFRRIGLPILSIGAIVLLCWILRLAFDIPKTTLATDLPASAEAGARFSLKDGSSFSGEGKIRIDGEEIACERIPADGSVVTWKGKLLRENPSTFKVVERGAKGTARQDHKAGAEVRQVMTLFFPENNATYGDKVDELFYLILWITGIAFILTEGFFLYCVLSFWGRPGERAVYTHGNHKLEMTWTVVPAVILVTLAILQSGMWTQMKMETPKAVYTAWQADENSPVRLPDVIPVQVVAKQFEWNFRQPGLDGKFGTMDDAVSTRELFVPKGRKVRLEMRSQDVIHSFFLPNFRLKQDVVPGLAIPAWFEAIDTGTFQIMCAELCGNNHTTMSAKLIVQTDAEYTAWLKEKSGYWKKENDGMERPEWYGSQSKSWWWWDANPMDVGFSGQRESRAR